jgi:hypothetical protein
LKKFGAKELTLPVVTSITLLAIKLQCLHDEAVGLRPAINDVNRRVTARHVAKQSE